MGRLSFHNRIFGVTKYDVCKESLNDQQSNADMSDGGKLHYMTLPRTGKQEWDPRMTMTSPVEWETSPLVTSADNDSIVSTPLTSKTKRAPDIISDNETRQILSNDIPDVISNNEATRLENIDKNVFETKDSMVIDNSHKDLMNGNPPPQTPRTIQKMRAQSEIYSKPRSKSRTGSTATKGHRSKSLYTSSGKRSEESEHFIIVNVPENAFTPGNLDAKNHNTILSIADDTATVVSEGVKCRYCLTNDTLNNEPLISPCQCCGTSKFVHKSCLEKWLTLRNLDACEVCKTRYKTKWVHRPLCSLNFPSMKKHDLFILFVTVSFYVTLIFQFLGAVYVSIMASALPPMVTIVTLVGLSLGLIWFLTGSIALTIILYTSDYWKAWRKANKRKVILLDANPPQAATMEFPSDLSQAVAV